MRRGMHRLVGADGYLTLAMSNGIIIATCGISWLWHLALVHRAACAATATPAPADVAVVLGFRLNGAGVCPQFATRLDRARALYCRGGTRRILIVGGRTGRCRISEAEAGRLYLLAHDVPDADILREEVSRHTLENLRHARVTLHALSRPVSPDHQPLPSGTHRRARGRPRSPPDTLPRGGQAGIRPPHPPSPLP